MYFTQFFSDCERISVIFLVRKQGVIKFVYSEKAKKIAKSPPYFCLEHTDKSKVEILQNFVAFSEYMNFTKIRSCFGFRY